MITVITQRGLQTSVTTNVRLTTVSGSVDTALTLAHRVHAGLAAQTAETQAGIAEGHAQTAETQAGIAEGHAQTAETQAGIAEGHAQAAETQAGLAQGHAQAAETQAGLAQGHAQTAETQAGIAEGHAQTAETQAGIAEGHAQTAETQAGLAQGHAQAAETQAGLAQGHAQTAETQAGLALRHAVSASQSYESILSLPPSLVLSGPPLITPAGAPLLIELLTRDAYTEYVVTACTGTVSLDGNTITYIGTEPGEDTLTIYAGASERALAIEVAAAANTLGLAPSAAPSVGAADGGGFYAGAIWDTVTTATGAVTVANGVVTVTVPPADLGQFYLDQRIRLATLDSRNAMLEGRVVAGSGDQLTLELDTILGGQVGASYSDWLVAARWRVIVAPRSAGEIGGVQWKTSNTAGPVETRTLTNGRAATAAMEAENVIPASPIYPMARWISALNSVGGMNGYADWYIPARDELELLWRNLKPVSDTNYTAADRVNGGAYTRDANFSDAAATHGSNRHSDPAGAAYTGASPAQTGAAAFQSGGAEALQFGAVRYLASSEFSATYGWSQSCSTSFPGNQRYANKTASHLARAVRRSID